MPEFSNPDFIEQHKFIIDEATFIAAQCSRRAGKSEAVGRKQMRECFRFPGSAQLYVGLTRESVRNIMWAPILKKLDKEFGLRGVVNETRLEITFSNGSSYRLFGADQNPKDIEKVLGGSYRSVVFDEAGSFRQNLKVMVEEMVFPAVSDWEGWVGLTGTPMEITKGLFYDATNGIDEGWSVHKWNTYNNIYMAAKWARQIALLKKKNPRVEETPSFRRMYKNEWVIDKSSLCYRYDPEVNYIEKMPEKNHYNNILGVDLGYNDSSAFSVIGYSHYDTAAYVRHGYKKSKMIISHVVKMIRHLIKVFNPIAIVVDGASKQAVEEMKQKYGLPLIAADKQGKADFIELLNSDLMTSRLKVTPEADQVAKEWLNLIWDKTKLPKKIEHEACENHLSDATLYAYRHAYHLLNLERETLLTEEDKIEQMLESECEGDEYDDEQY